MAELAGGLLLTHPRTRRLGARFAAVLFVAVFPGNVKMARDVGAPRTARELRGRRGMLWARLALQAPLVWWAWRLSRPSSPSPSSPGSAARRAFSRPAR